MKKIKLKFAILILIITSIIAVILSDAKYQEYVNSNSNAIVASFVFSSDTFDLEEINPDIGAKQYEFSVSNTNGIKSSEVSMQYIISIDNTGNIPLELKLYKKENGVINYTNLLTKGKTSKIEMPKNLNEQDYVLEVAWKTSSLNYDSYIYAGETNLIDVKINTIQKD